MKLLHVVQHTSAEFLGLMEDHLEGRNIRFRYYRPFTPGKAMPKADAAADGLILLGGGPWGTAGIRNVPTLQKEVALASEFLTHAWPIVGIGLGAQILAIAAGGASEAAPLEFSVTTAHRVHDDALNGYLPSSYPLAVYMRDRPLPPADAVVLARDERNRPALWQVGPRAIGFVGHPGLKVAMVEDLVMEFDEAPENVPTELARLQENQRALEDALVPIMTGLVQRMGWMDRAEAEG